MPLAEWLIRDGGLFMGRFSSKLSKAGVRLEKTRTSTSSVRTESFKSNCYLHDEPVDVCPELAGGHEHDRLFQVPSIVGKLQILNLTALGQWMFIV